MGVVVSNSVQGLFSSDPKNKFQVDKDGLRSLTVEKMAAGLQSTQGNQMAGIEGRTQLLLRLANALAEKSEYFGENGRPGNMIGMRPGFEPLVTTNTNTASQITCWHILQRRPPRRQSWCSRPCGTFS